MDAAVGTLERLLPQSWPTGVRRTALVGATTFGYAGLLVFLRGRPNVRSDGGIFLSVAAGLLRGDRLYSGVWDNKPPFFYYSDAVALRVLGWRGPFLLDVLWLGLAAWSVWLLLRAVGTSRVVAAVGYLTYPLFLTGAWYYTGFSELPALALAPLIPALWARGVPARAGAVLGIALFFRPDYALILFGLLGTTVALRRPLEQPLRRSLARLVLGFGLAVALSAALIASRGELGGFIDTMEGNLDYPNRALRLRLGLPPGLRGHIDSIRHFVNVSSLGVVGAKPLLALVLVFGIAPATYVLLRARSSSRPAPQAVVAGLLLATAATTTLTLALTAIWDHHLEPLALPATLLTVFLVSMLERRRRSPALLLAASVVVGACLLGLGGRGSTAGTVGPLSEWWHAPPQGPAEALNRARARAYKARETVTYAHVGGNDEDGSAAFLRSDLLLACPDFAQYVFSAPSYLRGAFACLEQRRPDLVLATPSFAAGRPIDVDWNSFVRRTRAWLRRRYVVAVRVPENGRQYVVWRRRS